MFKDKFEKSISSVDSMSMSLVTDTDVRFNDMDEKKHWKVTDVITHLDGTKEVRQYYNTVVDDCSKLIASLMKGQAGHKGVAFWAVGSGVGTWDNANPPSPLITDTKLFNETFRKAILPENITFLGAGDVPTASITNKIQVKVTFTESESNGELREFGLYGGTATITKDSGLMINRKTHGLIYKTTGMTLERTINIVF